jgi:hypothetical protein
MKTSYRLLNLQYLRLESTPFLESITCTQLVIIAIDFTSRYMLFVCSRGKKNEQHDVKKHEDAK